MAMEHKPAPRRVLIEVTYQIPVDMVVVGQEDTPLEITPAEARQMIENEVARRDWGGYSRLGKAFTKRRLSAWDATQVRVCGPDETAQPTMSEQLRASDAGGKQWSAWFDSLTQDFDEFGG